MPVRAFNLLFTSLTLGMLLCACTPDRNTQNDDSQQDPGVTGASMFMPNPQSVSEQPVETLGIGEAAPDFRLPDIDGQWVSLGDFDDAHVLVIVFTCAHCPTAQAYEDRLIQFTNDYRDRGVQVVAIMPNSVLGLLPEELGYTDLGDSFEEMKIRAEEKGYNFPFLYDGDDQAVSITYGPTTTPHVFVFDRQRKLQYTGNIDQNEKPGTGHGENLRGAVDAVLAGQRVTKPVTKAFGCSVKWAWKQEWAKKVAREWSEKEVTLEDIDLNGIKTLMRNNTGKLRLVNVWATWCAPCRIEFPHLIELQRMYGARNFEFVSISADKVEARDAALAFLRQSNAAITNYMYSGGDNYALIEAIDPEWKGALPYTALIEPGGNKAWRYQGAVDLLELKRAIVDHEMIGRYY